jgi:nicotinamidase-related amidase
MNYKFISIDFQNDFTTEKGICYLPRPSVFFVEKLLVPYLKQENIKISEIISDYRQPRPGDRGDSCHPGEWGYESQIPNEVKHDDIWIKCMNSPIWIRENIGDKSKDPGLPYQAPEEFDNWLIKNIGQPNDDLEVILFGLTVDCCVLCTAQQLSWRGYKVRILDKATDTYSGKQKEKEYILNNPPLNNWASKISWEEIKNG